jgi:hypothetical protein
MHRPQTAIISDERPMNIEPSLTVFFSSSSSFSFFFLLPMGRQVKKGYNKKRELGNLIMP